MKIINLKTNRIVEPIGFNFGLPSLSWTVTQTAAKRQMWAQIEIAVDGENIYNSGRREDISALGFRPELKLRPYTRYMWRVTVSGDNGETGVSDWSWFETAKMGEPWQAQWIAPDIDDVFPIISKTFTLEAQPEGARIYASGLGLYQIFINGERISDERFAPGLNSYDNWMQYQSYDGGGLFKSGENTIEIWLGDGISKGHFGNSRADQYNYCPKYTCICEARISLPDGERVIGSGDDWQWCPSKLTQSCIYDGEIYDANREGETRSVVLYTPSVGPLTERLSPPVKIKQELKIKELIHTPKGETVLDLGQNMTGWIRFKVNAPKGRELKLTYGEIMQDDCFYRDNLRNAKAEYHYISDGKPAIAEPYFTFYGFRYVKLEGFDSVDTDDFTGCVVYSDLEQIGSIETSDERVNRLFANALWSQRDNFLDVPTDCPQRDERMGWTGDAQVFSGTACFNMDCQEFYVKYLADMWYEQQRIGGNVPFIIPEAAVYQTHRDGGAVAWADAATVIPWNVYLHYGDISVLERQIDSMMAWVDWVNAQDNWENNIHFGDWVSLDNFRRPSERVGATDISFLCLAYHYYSAGLTAKALKALGRDSEKYETIASRTLDKLRYEFFTPNGRLAINTQTAYVVALFLGLSPDPKKTARELTERLVRDGGHLTTGFIGTPWLCRVLEPLEAYRLFLLDDCPSWLYEVKMGATTIWERWDSVDADGKITSTAMNSLNHYAYGSIVEWMYRNMCGINPVEEQPGYVKALIAPQPDPTGGISWARCELNSAAGRYVSAWRVENDVLTVELSIPFNCEALLRLPDGSEHTLDTGDYTFTLEFKTEKSGGIE